MNRGPRGYPTHSVNFQTCFVDTPQWNWREFSTILMLLLVLGKAGHLIYARTVQADLNGKAALPRPSTTATQVTGTKHIELH
jgi:hypothetical protein